MEEKQIKIDNLSIKLANKKIFQNFSLDIYKEEFVSIIGPSGSGKSTLLKIIANIIKDYDGNIDIFTPNIGYMPQDKLLLPFRTVEENIKLPLKIQNKKIDVKEFEMLVEKFEIGELLKKYPEQLSGGQQQRVALLRTYYMGKDLFLLDEPFAALDEISKTKLLEWVKKITKEFKITTVYVTHNIQEAINLSDRIVFLNKNGKVIDEIIIDDKKRKEYDSDEMLKKLID